MAHTYKTFIYALLFLGATVTGTSAYAQKTVITGTVRDAVTKETLPYVSVFFNDTKIGTQTDIDGHFKISTSENYNKLRFHYVGYEVLYRNITVGQNQKLDILLKSNTQSLNTVTITASKKIKYSNKNNPAVELIREVIEHKDQNQPQAYNTVQYKAYEKMLFSMSNISEKFKNKRIFKNYQFLFQEQDSTQIGGKNLLPIYIQEKLTNQYLSFSPDKSKSIVLAEKQVQFDNQYIDNDGLKVYFDRMYQNVNIYDSNIPIMGTDFLSPIASTAPTFYKFFITDTLKNQTPNLIELSFTPRTKGDLLFEGKMYITMDGNYAVQGASFGVNPDINLNLVRALHINLGFNKNTDNRYYLSKSSLLADFGINKNKGMGFTGERSVTYTDYQTNILIPDSVFTGKKVEVLAGANTRSNDFWLKNRLDSLPLSQEKIYSNIDTLQNLPSFKRTMKIVTLLFAGYYNLGPYEIGPTNTFYSYNTVEGVRFRFGGRTTPELSKRYYFENYTAYGLRDKQWKYFLSGTYSLNNKSIYKFPQNYIRASFQRDTKIPGQELQFVQEDNFLLSFKRGVSDMMLYNDFYRLDYVKEFENHFSYSVGFKKTSQTPAGSLLYTDATSNTNINKLTTTELSLDLRYAKNEKFYQGKIYRVPIIDRYPIYNLRYTAGIKGFLGGEYNYHNFMGSIDKRFYLSQFGFSDVRLEGGYIVGKLPFPLLSIHRANQTYAYQLDAYNLMNFLEFVSDRYASLHIDQHFHGFFLNKVPLLKKLKLREVVSFKAIYGGLRDENNPDKTTNGIYKLPMYNSGIQRTYSLDKGPYIEGSIGLTNIFKFVRIDLVKRFNYLDHPDVSEWGIRTRVKFDF